MGKYRVEVSSFVTRMATRHIYVNSKTGDDMEQKAIEKFCNLEMALPGSVDAGDPQVDSLEQIN